MLLKLEFKQQRITDEIMKYKDLLDEGVITKKEFSIKKEELLRKAIK
ncbi:MAG: SHOCT domain-containing protein [Clostridiaceae bacterium]|nr:SHOCT domain-containing protein [Clostridiaceae bacterium]